MSIQRPRYTSLLQLAADARGDDWAEGLAGAISAATFAEWTWERIFLTAARLIVDPDAEPGMLLEAQAIPGPGECVNCAGALAVAS